MRTRKLSLAALAFAVLTACASSAFGQDAFPDTPANHWAYSVLADAKKLGLLTGYPDGLFRGSRPASRYEMAVALHAVYVRLSSVTTELKQIRDQLDASEQASVASTQALKDQIDTLTTELNALKGYGDDIANLKRASETFELEFEQLGVNIEEMRRGLGDLSSRIGTLEKKKLPIDIHGDANFWLGAGNSRDGQYGLNKDGRLVGTGNPNPPSPLIAPEPYAVGLDHDLTILHEAAFTLAGTSDKGPQWSGTFVVTDMFGNPNSGTVAFGNQSEIFNPSYGTNVALPVNGLTGYRTGVEDVYIQDLSVRLGGPTANVQAGRVGYSISPYMMQRLDNTSYYSNPRWDNGLYYFDGAILGLNFGRTKLDIFGGRNSGLLSTSGADLNPMLSGPYGGPFGSAGVATGSRLTIDRSLGANFKVPIGNAAHINLSYLFLDSNTDTVLQPGQPVNRLDVYGGDGTLKLGPLNLQASYHKSDLKENSTAVNTTDNGAWNVKLGAGTGPLNLFGEYREIEANYLAPGDWGRLGVLRNPSNIKGFRVGASIDLLKRVTLTASGEFDSGLSNAFSATTLLGTQTGIDSYNFRLDYRLRPNLSVYGEYEDTRFGDLDSMGTYLGTPDYRWATFGIGYGIAANARFEVQYELSDVSNDYQASGPPGNSFHGGFLTSQLTLRF